MMNRTKYKKIVPFISKLEAHLADYKNENDLDTLFFGDEYDAMISLQFELERSLKNLKKLIEKGDPNYGNVKE